MITLTIQGKNAAEIRLELKRLLAEAATTKRDFNPMVAAPAEAAAEASAEAVEAVEAVDAVETTEAAEEAVKTTETVVTITEVRQALKDVADAFGLDVAQGMLHEYAPKLADLNADKYEALLNELKEKLG